jgi:cytochrome c
MRKTSLMMMMIATVALLSAAGTRAQDAQDGEALFKKQCVVCHTVEAGKNKIGPTLAGIVGQKAGQVPGFAYSDVMKNSGITWTPDNITKYLADPKGFMPGNKMVFAGLKKEEDEKAMIAYLATLK